MRRLKQKCRMMLLPARRPTRRCTEKRPRSPNSPASSHCPLPGPMERMRISRGAIDACLPETIVAFVEWLVRESGWKVRDPEDRIAAAAHFAPPHLPAVPPFHQLRKRHYSRLCSEPGGPRDPASSGRFEIVSQPRRSGNAARRAHRHRMAGRRACRFSPL